MSYHKKERMKDGGLFAELMPFGGKLDETNQWIVLEQQIPWDTLEEVYRKYYSTVGRRAKDSQLVNGLMIVKHMKNLSDEDVVQEFLENPYIQYFCGYDQLVTNKKEIEASTLSKVRGKVGVEYIKTFEEEIVNVLIEKKIIRTKEQMVDATVYPSGIQYPTDTGVLEEARKWLVGSIERLKKMGGLTEKIRTYRRKAREVYISLQRKKKKTRKAVRKIKKQLLQYVRRNIEQVKELLGKVKPADMLDTAILDGIQKTLEIAKKIYDQQREMYRTKTNQIGERIVSFWKPYVRPIVRGKAGKPVEFGPKCNLSYVNGYLFLDTISHESYHEGNELEGSLEKHEERFKKKPKNVITDKIYGTKANRMMLKEKGIRASIVPLGRKRETTKKEDGWIKKKQRERNRIEGAIGLSKTRYGLERLRYRSARGEEMNIRLGLIAMNLSTMLTRI